MPINEEHLHYICDWIKVQTDKPLLLRSFKRLSADDMESLVFAIKASKGEDQNAN